MCASGSTCWWSKGVRLASFAMAPKPDLIARLRHGGVLVMPSIGAKRHAEKVAAWGVDAVLVQGGEGGGHTGSVPTSLLLPQVVDVVGDDLPVVAAGGYFDGRGLVAALAYGASAIAMGTRFLLTGDSPVPQSVKELYLSKTVTETVVTDQVDGVPHRVLRSPLVEQLEGTSSVRRVGGAVRNAMRFRRRAARRGATCSARAGRCARTQELSWSQVVMAGNTPIMLRAAMVDGRVDLGVMASGQVVGMIDDLPSCAELIERIDRPGRGRPRPPRLSAAHAGRSSTSSGCSGCRSRECAYLVARGRCGRVLDPSRRLRRWREQARARAVGRRGRLPVQRRSRGSARDPRRRGEPALRGPGR